MRIEIQQNPMETKVLTDDGKDITADLCIKSIEVRVDPCELTTVIFQCYPTAINIDGANIIQEFSPPSPTSCYDAKILPSKKKPVPKVDPEAVLKQFKLNKPEA